MDFLVSVLGIILVDIILSGDNAILIALACKDLPNTYRKKAILIGSLAAVFLRVILIFFATFLFSITAFKFLGGLLLLFIAVELFKSNKKEIDPADNMKTAIKTIIVSDLIMSFDNVIGIAGIASGNYVLLLIGLLVSIPLIMYSSTLLLKLIDKYPFVIIIGSCVLAFTSGQMLLAGDLLNIVSEYVPYVITILVGIYGLFKMKYLSFIKIGL